MSCKKKQQIVRGSRVQKANALTTQPPTRCPLFLPLGTVCRRWRQIPLVATSKVSCHCDITETEVIIVISTLTFIFRVCELATAQFSSLLTSRTNIFIRYFFILKKCTHSGVADLNAWECV